MESSIWKKAGRFLREQVKNRRWRKILTVLGAVVVFVTAYILLMPAVAIERKNVCELEEHTHTDECYGQVLSCGKVGKGDETEAPVTLEFCCTFLEELHTHTEECYDRENNVICGYADYAVHRHNDTCYEDGGLICPLLEVEEHEHTEACYQINDSGYICGQEESEAHIHTDACYTDYRELTCEKAEREGHTHTDACYTKEWETVCGQEESEGHTHTESCYGEDGELICGQEEAEGHKHDETACYQVTEKLTCGRIESEGHEHDNSCYTVRRELTCGREENPNGHTHTEDCRGVVEELICGKDEVIVHLHTVEDGCYEAVLDEEGRQQKDENGEPLWTLVCGQPEVKEHVHGEECFKEHEHTEDCYEEGLVCGKEEHVHTEECIGKEEAPFYCAGRIHAHTEDCYDSDGSIVCGYADFAVHAHDETCCDPEGTLICPLPEIGEHTHSDECFNSEGSLVCELPEVSLHTHTEVCYDPEGVLICGRLEVREHHHSDACRSPEVKEEEPQEQMFSKTCEGDGYRVTVSYRADAGIPTEAELIAKQITQEENEAHYAERQAQFQNTLKDEGATIKALLKIGFYLNGEEIEPQSDVTVTVQLLDENGLAEGGPVTVVHFAKNETEVLDGSNVKDNSTTFQMGSFSEIAIGYRTGEKESAGIYISKDYEYEDDAFHIAFHIEGNAQPLEKEEELPAREDVNVNGAEAPIAEEDGEEEPKILTEGTEDPFRFQVMSVDKETDEYKEFLAYAEQSGGAEELISMQVFSYHLTYEGAELDLTNCRVTAKITMAPALKRQMSKSIPDAVSYLMEYEGETQQPASDVQKEASEPKQQETENEAEPIADDLSGEKQGEDAIIQEEPGKPAADPDGEVSDEQEKPAADLDEEITDTLETSKAASNETGITISVVGRPAADANPSAETNTDNMQLNSLASAAFDAENAGTEDKVAETALGGGEFSLRISATVNPHFTVQYYANLEKMKESGDAKYAVPLIDTSGRLAPQNGTGMNVSPNGNPIKNMYIDAQGVVTTDKNVLTEVYKSRQYTYIKAPTINYIDALYEKKAYYTLKEVWVYKGGNVHDESCYDENDELKCSHEDITSIDEEEWDIYTYGPDLHFTNKPESSSAVPNRREGGDEGYVLIDKNATIRLVYDVTTSEDEKYAANFYDYDITDGHIYDNKENAAAGGTKGRNNTGIQGDGMWYAHTEKSGINHDDNYKNKGEGAKVAFGNANTGTKREEEHWGNNYLNRSNGSAFKKLYGDSYKGCTFGLVKGLDPATGHIQYADGVIAPNLFNEGPAKGKTSYDKGEYSLKFNRSGDTYTLTAVNGTNAQNLHTFNHPDVYDGIQNEKVIWTNNFWPMDSAPSYGTDGHDLKFGERDKLANRKFGNDNNFPQADDTNDHNSYFGMQYQVEFTLSEDYVGPLEYYFYGDDDMWVFLDDQLVCDIGGVHSSVGEYVNLWDYLEKGSSGTHKLSFFYTERGSSGSTCWMQFTLPSASSRELTTNEDYGELKVSKEVEAISSLDGQSIPFESEEAFEFDIQLVGANGETLKDDYSYTRYSADGEEIESDLIVWSGGKFRLKAGEYIIIRFIPTGAHYTITEKDSGVKLKQVLDDEGNPVTDKKGRPVEEADESKKSDYYYFTDIEGDVEEPKEDITEGKTAEGNIPSANQSAVQYTNRVILYELPESGGSGTGLYTMAGISLLLTAGLMYRKKFRERSAGSSRN